MRVGVVADPHVAPAGADPVAWHNPYGLKESTSRLARALQTLLDQDIDVLAVLGDTSHLGDHESLRTALELMEACGVPAHVVAGNHDLLIADNSLPEALRAIRPRTTRVLSNRVPAHVGGWPLVGVPIARTQAGREFINGLEDTAVWESGPTILLSHYPVLSTRERVEGAGFKYAGDIDGADRVADRLLARRSPTVVLHGHLHIRDAVSTRGVLQLGHAALIEAPHEVAVIEVSADPEPAVSRRCIPIEASAVDRVPVLSPSTGFWRFRGSCWVLTDAGAAPPEASTTRRRAVAD